MPLRTAPPASPRRAALLRLLAAGPALALLAWGAQAQDAGLRGPVAAESQDAAALAALAEADARRDAADDDAPTAADAGGSLFDDPAADDADDPFADPEEPVEPRAPSTRKSRETAVDDLASPAKATPARKAAGSAGGAQPGDPDRPAQALNPREKPAEFQADDADEKLEAARTLRVPPVEASPRVDQVDADPFAPVGIRAGGFILRPSIETGVTVSSNAARTPDGSSGALSETTLRLDARSDWAEHSAAIEGVGTFRRSLSGEDEVEEVEGTVNADLLFELGHDWRARAGLSYTVEPESPSDRDRVEGAQEQPVDQTVEARAGLEKDLGPLRLAGTLSVERELYGEAELADGGTVDQDSRDSTLGLVTLRTGYELSPAVTPFVEVEGGQRRYDEGDDRNAVRLGARVGVALDLREKLTGEVAAGWLRESFRSDRFEPIEGPSLRAALQWSPVRGTVVDLAATTSVEGTTAENESGSLIQDFRLDVERTLRANLSAEAGLGLSYRDYVGSDGHDLTLIGEIGATWWLNRWTGLSGRLRHERLESNLPGRDYEENSVFLGTRLQY